MAMPMIEVNQEAGLGGGETVDSDIPSIVDETMLASQQSYVFDDDITDLIAVYSTQPDVHAEDASSSVSGLEKRQASDLSTSLGALTQSVATEPPDSSSSELNLLGKRKASDMSTSLSSAAGPFRPRKMQRSAEAGDDDNPFLDKTPQHPEKLDAPISISPVRALQTMFDMKQLPYGVQYEIARYVSNGKLDYKNFDWRWIPDLGKFKTNREAVPALKKAISGISFEVDGDGDGFEAMCTKERAAKSPWTELDREEEAVSISQFSGLGFNEKGEYLDWYGGQVLFHGKLQDATPKGCKKPSQFKLILEPAELGPSNMFARRFGSKHFFRLKLPKSVLNKNSDELLDYLRRPLILCGSVFRAFYAKASNAFYVKTNEPTDGISILNSGPVQDVMSFLEFLEWHNPMEFNNNQTMAKYASRFALGLSNSVPGLRLEQADIVSIDDIESTKGSNMTDGAGKINRWSLNQIRHRLGWEDTPTAIQTRIHGTKGLLVDDGKHATEIAYVELTPSQQKIHFPPDLEIDPAHRIIDVLRSSHTRTPCRLSVETIINLAENGVDKKVFVELLQKSLSELVEPLVDWNSQDCMLKLWCHVRRIGGVMGARRAREEAGLARVMGYSEKDADDSDEDEDGFTIDPMEERSSAWWGDEISGCPSSLEETIMCLVDSGFKPQNCYVLRDKLNKFIRARVNNFIKSYRIDVPLSASAFLVPDTSGILEPGEVFFKSSRRQFQTLDGMETDLFIGDVLVTRHPCKLPTDIQKWKSVDKPGLYHLTDVIVCSTKGDRRAADFLSGGDYDGDKGTFIWQPELVAPFKNAPLSFSEPPDDIQTYFERENEEVRAFQDRTKDLTIDNRIRNLQKYLLGAVRDTAVVGKYSAYHEVATYTKGYRHRDTIRLAYMFCMALDGMKTGMTVSKTASKADALRFQKRPPVWKETDEDKERYANERHAKRPKSLGRFIMDDLYQQAFEAVKTWHIKLDECFSDDSTIPLDDDLAKPWREACELARRYKDEENSERMLQDLNKIKKHVEEMFTLHRQEMAGSPRKTGKSPKKDKLSFTDQPIEVRQDKIREMSKKFASGPPLQNLLIPEEELARLRASYAYIYDFESSNGWNPTRFPFDVAMRELCAIKARALGRLKAVSGDFYDHFNMKHPKNHHF